MDKNAIIEAVRQFRAVMDERHPLLGVSFQSFPRGSCGDASELLAAYLKDKGLGDFSLVSGWRRGANCTSHAWLEKDDLIIDVTADQFEPDRQNLMVTTDQTWHAQFSDNRERRVDGDFRSEPPQHLLVAYEKLCQFLA